MGKEALEQAFPALRNSEYCITSDQTTQYNCVAWAAGDNAYWWEPDPMRLYYWPERKREWSVAALKRIFVAMGYEQCHDPVIESGYEKVAIYADQGEATHVARQLSSGMWTSKCGRLEDIAHTLEGLENCDGEPPSYGKVTLILKRPITPGKTS
jgi:hypothetical protein